MIDKSKALNDFHITEEILDEMLVEFVDQTNERIIKIEAALQNNTIAEAKTLAHGLKGVSGNLRLDTCYKIACTMDAALKESNIATIPLQLKLLKDAVLDIKNSIKPHQNET